tara:strand:- start:304 stop:465 length:162 start_codon:yes stop_codon:yes gene_type:complete
MNKMFGRFAAKTDEERVARNKMEKLKNRMGEFLEWLFAIRKTNEVSRFEYETF